MFSERSVSLASLAIVCSVTAANCQSYLPVSANTQFQIQNVNSSLLLGVTNQRTAAGASLVQWNDNQTPDHLWQFVPVGGGQYKIQNVHSGLLIGVTGASKANGAQVLQWSDNGTQDHLWTIAIAADGNFLIKNVNSGLYLEVAQSNTTTAGMIDQNAANGTTGQEWKIVDTGATSQAAPATSAQAPMFPYVVPQTVDPLLSNLTIPPSAATQGMWSGVQSWPFIGLHLTVLPDGRVLSFGAPNGLQGVQDGRTLDIWNPALGFAPASHVNIGNGQLIDSFCGTATLLPSGAALLSGGASLTSGYTSFGNSVVNSSASSVKASPNNLSAQRWYATMMTLADGRQLITGGGTPYAIVGAYANPSQSEPNISETPEVYSAATGWTSLFGASSANAFGPINNRAWYPRQWVAPDSTVFGISTDVMWDLDPTGSGALRTVGNFKTTVNTNTLPNVGPTSTAVMYDTGKILQAGGNGYNNGYASPSSPYATIVDISNTGAPVLKDTNPMTYARQWANSTVLPDGTVAVTGGTTYGDNAGTNAVYPAELWNPSTGTWSVGASAAVYRGYHSAVVLLQDGALLSDGGGAPGPFNNLNAEIYYPPYLFTSTNGKSVLATRPQIISLSTNSTDYGNTLSAQVGSNTVISEASLIGLSSVTHSFNTAQRRIKLTYSQSGTALYLNIPGANLLPPGYYQLTVLNQNRVPSAGAIVAVHAVAPPTNSISALLPIDGALRSIQLANAPTYVLRHANFQTFINPITPASGVVDRNGSSFYTRPGLASPACYSFESKDWPGYFLRHQNFRLLMQNNDASPLFAQDATFCAVAGLSGSGFSLQSFNYPQNYIHMRAGTDLWLDVADGTSNFNQNASFLQTVQYLPSDGAIHSFANFTLPGELIRHQNFVGYIASINSASTALDRADASFIVHPGNANAACYSFESSGYPGRYLRHYNFALRLDPTDGSVQWAHDSTFCLTNGLAGSGFSLTGLDYPTYYVRQQGQQLLLNVNDNTQQFQTDATFSVVPAP